MINFLQAKKIQVDPACFYQNLIKDYLIANADDKLKAKILGGTKNLPDCMEFVFNSIREDYIKQFGKTSGGYCDDDKILLGYAVHYFDEDSITSPKLEPFHELTDEEKKKAHDRVVEQFENKERGKLIDKANKANNDTLSNAYKDVQATLDREREAIAKKAIEDYKAEQKAKKQTKKKPTEDNTSSQPSLFDFL